MIQNITIENLRSIFTDTRFKNKYIIFLLYRNYNQNIKICLENNKQSYHNATGKKGLFIPINEGHPLELEYGFEQYEELLNGNPNVLNLNAFVTIYTLENVINNSCLDTPCLIITNSRGVALGKYVFRSESNSNEVNKVICFFIESLNNKCNKLSTIFATIQGKFTEFINIDKLTLNNILDIMCKKSNATL